MKIDQSSKVSLQSPARTDASRTPAPATQSASAQATSTAQENVTLNPAAAQLGQADQTGGDNSVFDSERVASLRQAISEGRFTVSSDRIADKLISSVQDLLQQ
ncbi:MULTISPECIES: flagellar biosynthesis anti-sigma factor FlgM [Silvimonas]|uniref:flagellar biosynthesis anti-sigma factor FlgM n=1 Tax=Silvimonas TaxID=300264 RepID=UPI0024B329BE|nr:MULTISPECIES: flagellar biosynthesis anti-sigma factor FlgM [Silvimonas]MDR3428512.1 flagellar biosynthesis anti-sigma factor FlgM [Silvimonas sp.]